ncbi:hypothetical protein HY498_01855 [Candidatus Woesearchaeota archaeon]|nr:hypothetical protein [Candidatus Woesearchaeota archaeon]
MSNKKAQASLEVLISISIILFLFTIIFLLTIIKGYDAKNTDLYMQHREECIKISSLLFLTSVFDYKNEFNSKFSYEITRNKNLISIYKTTCYAYTKDLDNIYYSLDAGNFKMLQTLGGVKIESN